MAYLGPLGHRNGNITAALNSSGRWHKRRRTIQSLGGQGTVTDVVCYYSRYWWGEGVMLIHVFRYYYGPNSDYSLFRVNGHTRSGNPSIGTLISGGAPTPFATDYNSGLERSTIKLSVGDYFRCEVMIECIFMNCRTSNDVGVGSGYIANSWHMPSSHEVI